MLKAVFTFFFVGWLSLMPHKFYVSTTVIVYKEAQQSLQITSQIFIDDLELLLRKENANIRLAPDSKQVEIDSLVGLYFKKKLKIQTDGAPLPIHYLGKEYKNDIAVHYLELNLKEVPKSIRIENQVFLELFEDQKNIIHFKHKQTRKSFLLHKNNPYIRFDL